MNPPNKSYRPEIDGLRALSVISVVLNHANLGVPGGYVGVEVFFVISGFLITQLILKELDEGTFSLADFWVRRIRRILPALAAMILTVLFAGYWLLSPHDLEQLGKSSVSQSLLVSNIYFLLDQGLVAMPKSLKPLVHTWSLAVEEQFYLFFPLLLWSCSRLRRSHLVAILLAIAAISFSFSCYYVATDPSTAFFLLPSRAWELLMGSLLAFVPKTFRMSKLASEITATLGLTAILSSFFLYNNSIPFPGLSAALPVAGAAAVILANTSQMTFVGKLLSLKPLTFVGQVSYSLYLWHWPILVFFTCAFGGLNWVLTLGVVALSFLVSVLSWHFIERPFRGHTTQPRRKYIFASAFAVQVALLAISVVFWRTEGYPQRLSTEQNRIVSDLTQTNSKYESFVRALEDGRTPSLGQTNENREIDFALFGDGQAVSFAPLFDHIARRNHRSGIIVARRDVPPFPVTENVKKRNELFLNVIQRKQIKHVFIACEWDLYVNYNEYSQYLSQLLGDLNRAGARHVSILRQIPAQNFGDGYSRHLFVASRFPSVVPLRCSTRTRHESALNREATFFNKVRTGTTTPFALIDAHQNCFDVNGQSRVIESRRVLYSSTKCLTNIGAELLLGETIESAFVQMDAITPRDNGSPVDTKTRPEEITLGKPAAAGAARR